MELRMEIAASHRAASTERSARPFIRSLAALTALLAAGLLGAHAAKAADVAAKLPVPATIALSPSGNDASCGRNNPSRPCATFDRAYQLARGGDTVVVAGGRYAMTEPSAGASSIFPAKQLKGGTVSFVCKGDGDVSFTAPVFAFYPGLGGVTVSGGCFHFHVVYFGYGGYSQGTHDITLDGVHMESFNVAGAKNVTISNSEIGPFVACYEPDDGTGAPAYAFCDPGSYWASQDGTSHVQQEPFLHNGGAGPATNIVLDHVHIHGISSKWNGTHTGGLLVWNVNGLTIKNSTFDHDAIYDIEENAGSSDSAVTMTNNTFGAPVYSFDPNEPSQNTPLPNAWREVTIGGSGSALNDWLIQGNTFTNGLAISTAGGGSFEGVSVFGNLLGNHTTCIAATGLAFDSNLSFGSRCGVHPLWMKTLPYLDEVAGYYRLEQHSPAACFIANVRSGMSSPTAACRTR
jgi:hypothetical protein